LEQEEIHRQHINLVLDEAHGIKKWGGTFQSDYLQIWAHSISSSENDSTKLMNDEGVKHTDLRHSANKHKPPQQLLPVARENKQKLEFRSTTTNISDVV
jgi:superfamily II DNA helicase RecQ